MIWYLSAAPPAARSTAAAALEAFETAARAISEWEWALARGGLPEPLSRLAAACGDMTRDLAAVALSSARWLLDL